MESVRNRTTLRPVATAGSGRASCHFALFRHAARGQPFGVGCPRRTSRRLLETRASVRTSGDPRRGRRSAQRSRRSSWLAAALPRRTTRSSTTTWTPPSSPARARRHRRGIFSTAVRRSLTRIIASFRLSSIRRDDTPGGAVSPLRRATRRVRAGLRGSITQGCSQARNSRLFWRRSARGACRRRDRRRRRARLRRGPSPAPSCTLLRRPIRRAGIPAPCDAGSTRIPVAAIGSA